MRRLGSLAHITRGLHLPHSTPKIALRSGITTGILAGYVIDHGLGFTLGLAANLAWIWFDAD